MEIIVSDEADEVIKNFLIHLKIDNLESMKGNESLSSVMFGYCIINVIK